VAGVAWRHFYVIARVPKRCVTLSPRSLLLQIDPPLSDYKIWNDTKAGPTICPPDRFRPFGNLGAKSAGMRRDSNSSKIESIGIPTGTDGHIGMIPFVRVAMTCRMKQVGLMVVEIKNTPTKFGGKLSSTWTMFGIGRFVQAT
jgi:hypothetical protein